ncbi:hypothetical protein [Ferrimonas senticii]|uniref:hypothetical protein n=1 Tax=Ferrimonas senticii TaxID=394566 RepID=UPI0003F9FCE5|nr:hypothetical protein [Ferrimonas senticii]
MKRIYPAGIKTIVLALASLLGIATVIGLFSEVGIMALMLVPVGLPIALLFSVIGIPLLVTIYGWPAALASGLSALLAIVGLVNHQQRWGQIAAVIGISAFTLLSMYGLGHGG